jgi:outer membrane receptor protein involved in Fe transport
MFHVVASILAAAAPEAAASVTVGVMVYGPEFFADARPANAMEMVERLPGFAFDGGDDVRGFEGAAGNVLIDGQRPTSKTDDLEESLRRVPASRVARVELIRGGAPGVDMQGKAVLANVVLKDGGGFRGLVSLSNNHIYDGRNAQGVRLEGSGGADGRTWEAGLRWGRGVDDGAGEGPRIRLDGAGRPLAQSQIDSQGDIEQKTATGAFETPLLGGKLRLNGRLFGQGYDADEIDLRSFPTPGRATSHDNEEIAETELGLRFSRDLGPRTNIELMGLQQTKEQDFTSRFETGVSAEVFALDNETGERIARGVLKFRKTETLSFELGGEGAFNWLESATGYTVDGVAIPLPAANVRVEEKRGELFGKAVWRPSPRWTVEGGLRAEGSAISSEGDVALEKTLYFWKPRLALSWAPDAKTQVRATVERSVGQLDFGDFVASSSLTTGQVTAGNPDLEPEQAWVVEASIERRFWSSGAIVATVRHSALSDVVDRAPSYAGTAIFDAPANIGDGTKDELTLNLTLPLERLGVPRAQLKTEATWRKSEVTDPTTGEKREISDLRPLEWEAHLTHDLPQWKVNWGVDVYSGFRETSYRFDEVSTFKLKTYVTPFVEWKPQPDLSIRAEMGNATERGLRRTRTVYDGPRGGNPVRFTDDRDIQFGRMVYLRVRKTFGG